MSGREENFLRKTSYEKAKKLYLRSTPPDRNFATLCNIIVIIRHVPGHAKITNLDSNTSTSMLYM
jgi:hypothetical protein